MKMKAQLPLFAMLLIAAACSQPHEYRLAEGHAPEPSNEIKTAKPGAVVIMTSELRSPVVAGDTGTLDLRFEEAYTKGRLSLDASTNSDGISVYGPSSATTRDLSVPGHKDWTVLFTAEKDGIHYINVLATVEVPGEPVVSRAFSARVEVGDTAAAIVARELDVDVVTQSDGRRVKILPAEESENN